MDSLQQCWEKIVSMNGTIAGAEKQRRKVLLVAFSMFLMFLLFYASVALRNEETREGAVLIVCLLLPTQTYVILRIVSLHEITNNELKVLAAVNVITCVISDLNGRSTGTIAWPFLVLVVDFLLIMRVGNSCVLSVVVCGLLWIFTTIFEDAYRIGIYDIPFITPSQSVRRDILNEKSDCTDLPCARGLEDAMASEIAAVLVFVMDFIATRGFANEVVREQDAMQRTINTVQEITQLLSRYDVDAVAERLASCKGDLALPEMMEATLQQMEANLRTYKPYLPGALFEMPDLQGNSVSRTFVPPPGGTTGEVTVVFTDIRASTLIWQQAPEAMRKALRIHDRIIRHIMEEFGGYEVKSLGDAFMVAFETLAAGVSFALKVQEELNEVEWPAGLDTVPICAQQGHLWGGLTVRIGVNSGPVTVEQNPLNGRMDYFGHTVNVAARLEGVCVPGAVALPASLWSDDFEAIAVAGEANPLSLKGVVEPLNTCSIWPRSLADRRWAPLEMQPKNDITNDVLRVESGSSLVSLTVSPQQPTKTATFGVIDVNLGAISGEMLQKMNSHLTSLKAVLDQSGGTLVSLLGGRVCVGWNIFRSVHAHAENAIRFAHRMKHTPEILRGVGLATGDIQHGEVGSRTQRFFAVCGTTVKQSWTLCDATVKEGKSFLYRPPTGIALPASLTENLLAADELHPGVYGFIDDVHVFEQTVPFSWGE